VLVIRDCLADNRLIGDSSAFAVEDRQSGLVHGLAAVDPDTAGTGNSG
jgi:hypothetical protein